MLPHFHRCDAKPDNLDNPDSALRTRERTANLLKNEDPDVLWYQHGIVPDLQVCYLSCLRVYVFIGVSQPFTMNFPRADIHELLTPDLLHQLIKGTFKDHLVEWVKDYLNAVHSASNAEMILDEIDRRYELQVYLNTIYH